MNQHPRIRIPDIETDFFPFLARWVAKQGEPSTEDAFRSLYEAIKSATYFTLRNSESGAFSWRTWREWCAGRFDAAGLFEGIVRYESDAARDSNILWGDKSPAYIRHIELLLQHFPDARIIHIVRDVRDHCVSIRQAWNKDIKRAAFHWGRDVHTAHRLCVADPKRCIEIRYESLLENPEGEMRRLCSFMAIEFLPEMTRLSRPQEVRGDANGRTEIVRNNSRKFTERLTVREIRAVESLAYDTLAELGYPILHAKAQRTLGPMRQRILQIKDGLYLVMRGARRRGLAHAFRFHLSHARITG
jgi:Sulfotransferase family